MITRIPPRPRSRRTRRASTSIGAFALAFVAVGVIAGASPAVAVDGALPPMAQDDSYVMVQGATLTVGAGNGVLANDSDGGAGAGPLHVEAFDGYLAAELTAGGEDGSFTYTPDPGFVGTRTFSYTLYAAGSQLYASSPASITINVVAAVNAAPVVQDDVYEMEQATEGPTHLTIGPPGILGNDADPDGDPMTVCDWAADDPDMFEVAEDGSVIFAPGADFTGTVELFYWACDDADVKSGAGRVTFTVTAAVLPEPQPQHPQSSSAGAPAPTGLAETGVGDMTGLLATAALLLIGGAVIAIARGRRRFSAR